MSTKKTKLSIQAPKVSAQTKSGAPKCQKQILTAQGQILHIRFSCTDQINDA
jgi:hypothetical protein